MRNVATAHMRFGACRGGVSVAKWQGVGSLQSWTKYIETMTEIQVELINPQLHYSKVAPSHP